MKTMVIAAMFAAAFAAPVALAGEGKTMADHDTDASGTLSLAEVQAAKPKVTAEKFAKYDTDGNGELSQAEYDAWKAASAAKKDETASTGEKKAEY